MQISIKVSKSNCQVSGRAASAFHYCLVRDEQPVVRISSAFFGTAANFGAAEKMCELGHVDTQPDKSMQFNNVGDGVDELHKPSNTSLAASISTEDQQRMADQGSNASVSMSLDDRYGWIQFSFTPPNYCNMDGAGKKSWY